MTGTEIIIPEHIRSAVREAAVAGETAEILSQRMADMGLEKIVAIRLLADTLHLRLGTAKDLIHCSPAWAFRRADDEAFHESLLKTATEAGLIVTRDGGSSLHLEEVGMTETGSRR